MTRNWKLWLLVLLAAGTALRVVLAFATYGSEYDQASFAFIHDALSSSGLDVYAARDGFGAPRWPYPPAFFPWITASGELSSATGAAFHGLIALPTIMADAALAWVVQGFLGKRGKSPADRLVAAGLIALGPSFVLISGYHNHFDSLAILPAVCALSIWDQRGEGGNAALKAGLLIGVGCALKTVPILMLLALIPTARSRKEGITLTTAAIAVPAVLVRALSPLRGGPDAPIPGLQRPSRSGRPEPRSPAQPRAGRNRRCANDVQPTLRNADFELDAGQRRLADPLERIPVSLQDASGPGGGADLAHGLRARHGLLLSVPDLGSSVLPHGRLARG